MATLGDKVRMLRRDRKWTLKDLSIRSGVSQSYISAIEKGARLTPSFECVEKISDAFDVPIQIFCSGRQSTIDANSGSMMSQAAVRSIPDMEQSLIKSILQLYDRDTRHFIASESSLPYVAFARQLAEDHDLADPSEVLQLIARFLRDQKQAYQEGEPLR